MTNREVRRISVDKIIALDIDEFRVGVVGYGYQDVRSSVYSEVKKNNLQYLLGKNNEPTHSKNKVGERILLGGSEQEITWASTSYIVDVRRLTKPLEIHWQPLETKILRHISKRYFLI